MSNPYTSTPSSATRQRLDSLSSRFTPSRTGGIGLSLSGSVSRSGLGGGVAGSSSSSSSISSSSSSFLRPETDRAASLARFGIGAAAASTHAPLSPSRYSPSSSPPLGGTASPTPGSPSRFAFGAPSLLSGMPAASGAAPTSPTSSTFAFRSPNPGASTTTASWRDTLSRGATGPSFRPTSNSTMSSSSSLFSSSSSSAYEAGAAVAAAAATSPTALSTIADSHGSPDYLSGDRGGGGGGDSGSYFGGARGASGSPGALPARVPLESFAGDPMEFDLPSPSELLLYAGGATSPTAQTRGSSSHRRGASSPPPLATRVHSTDAGDPSPDVLLPDLDFPYPDGLDSGLDARGRSHLLTLPVFPARSHADNDDDEDERTSKVSERTQSKSRSAAAAVAAPSANQTRLEHELARRNEAIAHCQAEVAELGGHLRAALEASSARENEVREARAALRDHVEAVRAGLAHWNAEWVLEVQHLSQRDLASTVAQLDALAPTAVREALEALADQSERLVTQLSSAVDLAAARAAKRERHRGLARAWRAWRDARRRRQVLANVLARRQNAERRHGWQVWRRFVLLERLDAADMARATQHFAAVQAQHARVAIGAWRVWSHARRARGDELAAAARAVLRWRRAALLARWRRATDRRVRLAQLADSFARSRRFAAAVRAMGCWRRALDQARQRGAVEERDELRATTASLRVQLAQRTTESAAHAIDARRLAQRAAAERIARLLAESVARRLARSWNTWRRVARDHAVDELRHADQRAAAAQHERLVRRWEEQLDRVSSRYAVERIGHLARLAIERWRAVAARRHALRVRADTVAAQRQRHLLQVWRASALHQRTLAEAERNVSMRRTRRIAARTLGTWLALARARAARRSALGRCLQRATRHLIPALALARWRASALEHRRETYVERIATRRVALARVSRMRAVLRAWRAQSGDRAGSRTHQLARVLRAAARRPLARAVQRWREATLAARWDASGVERTRVEARLLRQRLALTLVAHVARARTARLLAARLERWRAATRRARAAHVLARRCTRIARAALLRQALRRWSARAVHDATVHATLVWCNAAGMTRQAGDGAMPRLSVVWSRWRRATAERLAQRLRNDARDAALAENVNARVLWRWRALAAATAGRRERAARLDAERVVASERSAHAARVRELEARVDAYRAAPTHDLDQTIGALRADLSRCAQERDERAAHAEALEIQLRAVGAELMSERRSWRDLSRRYELLKASKLGAVDVATLLQSQLVEHPPPAPPSVFRAARVG